MEGNDNGIQPRSTHPKFKIFYIFSLDMLLHYKADLTLLSVFKKKKKKIVQKGQQTLTHLMILEVVTVQ